LNIYPARKISHKAPIVFQFKTPHKPFKRRVRLEVHSDIPQLNNQPIACITAAECVIIMAEKHTSETRYLSLKEKGKSNA